MGKVKQEPVHYQSIPHAHRFWVYAENCYTEEELNLRQWILKVRANSGIHPDFLVNPSSWFAEDNQALINPNEQSWFFSNTFKPRHILSRDDFHVQPIDSQRLQWPTLYNLMQKTGDYLLIRNQNLPEEHLNQPMNYVLLDINLMLKALSQNHDINQVKEQLELITRYLRTIEKNISPLVGSDRLFLANFRAVIDDSIYPQLMHKIESQLLKDRLEDLSKTISKLSTDRNRILHFALNINPVNPHPYGFSIEELDDIKAYPTQSAKNCGQTSTELTTEHVPTSPSLVTVTMDQLKECPNFKLIQMDEVVLAHYSGAISDLNELDRFQKVVTQIIDLLGQAGEVYTIHQFKEQMITLLKQIDGFIDNSSLHIDEIIRANTAAYHKAIQEEQTLPLWKKLLTQEKQILQTYIKNQDTLAQYPSSTSDLSKTNKALKEHVNQVIGHLSQPKRIETSFEAVAGKAQELNLLMNSMHNWIKTQYQLKGLEAPKPPEPLQLLSGPVGPQEHIPEVIIPVPPPISNHAPLFSPKLLADTSCNENEGVCNINENKPMETTNVNLYLSFLALAPIGILILYLLLRRSDQKEEEHPINNEAEFTSLKDKIEDLITEIGGTLKPDDKNFDEAYEEIVHNYRKLLNSAKRKDFDVFGLEEVRDDLNHLCKEFLPAIQIDDESDLGLKPLQ